jgi:hypothetical protein
MIKKIENHSLKWIKSVSPPMYIGLIYAKDQQSKKINSFQYTILNFKAKLSCKKYSFVKAFFAHFPITIIAN